MLRKTIGFRVLKSNGSFTGRAVDEELEVKLPWLISLVA